MSLNRDDLDRLIMYAVGIQEKFETIRNHIYSSEEEYNEDQVVIAVINTEHSIERLNESIRYLDEEAQSAELESAIEQI